jgi:hypothetical protein
LVGATLVGNSNKATKNPTRPALNNNLTITTFTDKPEMEQALGVTL